MSNPDDEYDVDQSDLQAALGDLLGEGGGDDGGQDLGDDALDLSMLEDAVAELGIDVGNDDADEEPGAPREIALEEPDAPAGRNLGLDLTELPPPPGPPADVRDGGGAPMFNDPPAEPARKLPPLGQASAADLFGDDEDWDDGADLDLGLDDGPAETPAAAAFEPEDLPPPPGGFGGDDVGADDLGGTEPAPVEIRPDDMPRATPVTDEVIAFAAHKGRLTGEIATKARKLFGRG